MNTTHRTARVAAVLLATLVSWAIAAPLASGAASPGPRTPKARTPQVRWYRWPAPMAAVLLVAMITVHLPYGFSSIKLQAITAAGAQFGPPGVETDLLYLACLVALVLGGSGPLAIDGLLAKRGVVGRP